MKRKWDSVGRVSIDSLSPYVMMMVLRFFNQFSDNLNVSFKVPFSSNISGCN